MVAVQAFVRVVETPRDKIAGRIAVKDCRIPRRRFDETLVDGVYNHRVVAALENGIDLELWRTAAGPQPSPWS